MNDQLLAQVYQKYHREILLYLYSLSKNRALAEDLTQETFLKAFLSLADQHVNIRAWLYLVARNLYFDWCRRHEKESFVDQEEHLENHLGTAEDSLTQILAKETNRSLYRCLQQLDLRQREVLTLHYINGLKQRDIARIMNLSAENVRLIALRGRRKLRELMEKEESHEV